MPAAYGKVKNIDPDPDLDPLQLTNFHNLIIEIILNVLLIVGILFN